MTLPCPLTPETRHLIDAEALRWVKPGVMLIDTSRGAVIDTLAVLDARTPDGTPPPLLRGAGRARRSFALF